MGRLAEILALQTKLQNSPQDYAPTHAGFVAANRRNRRSRDDMASQLAALLEAAEQEKVATEAAKQRQEAEKSAAERTAQMENLTRLYGPDAASAIYNDHAKPSDFAKKDEKSDSVDKRFASGQRFGLEGNALKHYALTGKLPDPEDASVDWDAAAKLRGELNKQTDEFPVVTNAYARVKASAGDPSAAGDLALIFNYMKILDPGSTVREGEFANAENSGGVSDKIRGTYNKLVDGKRLTPERRYDFLNRAGRLYSEAVNLYQGRRSEYDRLATNQGFDPDIIFVDRQISEITSFEKPPAEMSDEELAAAIEAARGNP